MAAYGYAKSTWRGRRWWGPRWFHVGVLQRPTLPTVQSPHRDRDVILRPRPDVPAVSSAILAAVGQMFTNPQGTGRLLLEGDSFAPPLAGFLARHFESVLVPETGRFDGKVVARHRPGVLLLEVAERNLNRLARERRQLASACDR